MEDTRIIELYIKRDEAAISETSGKYGRFLHFLAMNVLSVKEDAEECVSDTYVTAWNKIPPIIPDSLKAFLGRIVRDNAISKYRANHAAKRYSGMDVLLSELEEVLPSEQSVDRDIEREELSRIINRWLLTLPADSRNAFVRRYWYADSVKSISFDLGISANTLAQRLFNLRKALKEYLEGEGIEV
ncbi:MAG: sigma-70 family RNA polymerase sigma factor [Lachnospiraceae bacterium]|nr:sigma-70 family RNA polymerase sigma factor [Lachnospiraceae bacterium]